MPSSLWRGCCQFVLTKSLRWNSFSATRALETRREARRFWCIVVGACPVPGTWPIARRVGRAWPIAGRTWPIAGRTWPVSGRAWPVAGRAWPVAGRAWPIAGRTWTVAGRAWPVAGRTWPVSGKALSVPGRYFGVAGRMRLTWTLFWRSVIIGMAIGAR